MKSRQNVDNLPSAELIDSTHAFPGPYTFKVIGRPAEGFVARIIAAVREELEGDVDPPYRIRETAAGPHLAAAGGPLVQTSWGGVAVVHALRAARPGGVLFLPALRRR